MPGEGEKVFLVVGGAVDGDHVVEAEFFGRAEGGAGSFEAAAGHLVDLRIGGVDAQLVEAGGHPDAVVEVYHGVDAFQGDLLVGAVGGSRP